MADQLLFTVRTSYLVEVTKSGDPQPAQTNVPSSLTSFKGDVHAGSVPSLRSTLNCSGLSISFHSSSVFSMMMVFVLEDALLLLLDA